MITYRIPLPWPAPALWQNRRPHWSTRSKAVAKARQDAKLMARGAGLTIPMPDAILRFEFYPPPMSRPDIHNMPATMKAYIDGIADAMGCDDRHFRPMWPTEFCDRKPGGAVVIEVEPVSVAVPFRGAVS